MKLLIVEDETDLRETMADYFRENGNLVLAAKSVFEAEDLLLTHQFDVLILDIGLPDGSGLDCLKICSETQENSGVLIVSAKNSVDDKIKGLDLGADDYITKPFHIAELNSRINALIRRKFGKGDSRLVFNELSINLLEKQAYVNDETLVLTKKEFELLQFLLSNKERVLTKESIVEHVWGEEMDGMENVEFIYTHVKNLRKKITQLGGNDYLKTVHGMGYKFTDK